MIFNTGDIVMIDDHFKKNLNGREGEIIRVDYDKEVSLFDDGKKVFWVRNEFLTKIREFYDKFNHNEKPWKSIDRSHGGNQIHQVFR